MTPRLLTIMGSGETSPTMVKAHRALLARVGGDAVFLDTPVGFQENAGEIADRVQEYFDQSVGTPIEVARLRSGSTFESEAAIAAVRRAAYVFSGPGSPTYALARWAGTAVPDLLRDKLRTGGAVTFASAAALTLGVVTVPVYEIYKVGEPPHWLPGLDLLAEAGLSAAVIPHFNNAEGGTHDTRYCYLGERRLAAMEADLPDGAFVLGVDEHTGAVIDLDARTLEVVGIGAVTVRDGGRVTTFAAGEVVGLDDLRSVSPRPPRTPGGSTQNGDAAVTSPPASPSVTSPPASPSVTFPPASPSAAAESPSPLLARIGELEQAFATALAAGDGEAAGAAVLDAEEEVHAWSQYTSDEVGKARMRVRAMIVGLAGAVVDPAGTVSPFVETLLTVRDAARAAGDYGTADLVRDRLVEAGVEVRDSQGGTTWRLLS